MTAEPSPLQLNEHDEGPRTEGLQALRDKIWAEPLHDRSDKKLSEEDVQTVLQSEHETLWTELLTRLDQHFKPERQVEVGARLTEKALMRARQNESLWTRSLDMAALQFLDGADNLEDRETEQALQQQLNRLGDWIAEQDQAQELIGLLGFRSNSVYQTLIASNNYWSPEFVGKLGRYAIQRNVEWEDTQGVLNQLMEVQALSAEALVAFLRRGPGRTTGPFLSEPIRRAANHPSANLEVAQAILEIFQEARNSVRGTEKLLESKIFQAYPQARQELLERETWDDLMVIFEGRLRGRFEMDRHELVQYIVRGHADRFAQHLQEIDRRSVRWRRAEIELFLSSHSQKLRKVGLRTAKQLQQFDKPGKQRGR